jgi:hypothetical protein
MNQLIGIFEAKGTTPSLQENLLSVGGTQMKTMSNVSLPTTN